jgi:anti-sigma-K factor RskA
MRRDPAFRAEVERLRPLVLRLETLPAEAWEGIAPPPPPALTPEGRRWRAVWPKRLVLRPLVAVAASLALLGAGTGIGVLASREADQPPVVATYALSPLGGGATGAHAVATLTGGGALRVELSGLAPTPPGRFYELWLLNSPTDLVAIGSFRVPASGRVTVTVPLPDDPARFQFLDISVEPSDGNPAHSGDSVLRGETA